MERGGPRSGPPFFVANSEMMLSLELEKTILPVLERMGVNLVLGTFRREGAGKVLRLFIERQGADPDKGSGVDVELCARVSREIGYTLDVSDVLDDDAYRLEVSSPGIERPLVKPADFERFSGRKAKIVTRQAIEGRRSFTGVLNGLEGDAVSMDLGGEDRMLIPNEIIKKANLVFEYKV